MLQPELSARRSGSKGRKQRAQESGRWSATASGLRSNLLCRASALWWAQTPKTRSHTTTSTLTRATVLTRLPPPHAVCSRVHTCTPHLHGERLALSARAYWGENRAPHAALTPPPPREEGPLRAAPPVASTHRFSSTLSGPWQHSVELPVAPPQSSCYCPALGGPLMGTA